MRATTHTENATSVLALVCIRVTQRGESAALHIGTRAFDIGSPFMLPGRINEIRIKH